MKRFTISTLAALMTFLFFATSAEAVMSAQSQQRARMTTSFDADWRFLKADAPGAEKPEFNDAAWRSLNVPHDWSIEGPFDRNNPTRGAGGFLPAGVGWYRKHFTLPAAYAGRRVFIDFDGVMANSDVWINGHHLGKRPFGYVSFRYELTGHLNFGQGKTNVLAVRADNSGQPASRWYTGAGIYRHVRLVVTNPVHLGHWATFVTTPQVSAAMAVVRVQTAVVNQAATARNVALQISLINPAGQVVQNVQTKPQIIAAGQSGDFQQEISVRNPQLWNLDRPNLYRVVTRVRAGNSTLDEESTPFGIRQFKFEAATGFWLNGKNMKIKGVCLHHDAGALGAAVPLRAWERHFEHLKQVGVNAIRTAHNPMDPEFLDLCDRMGFLVMNETFDVWIGAKEPYDYHLYFNEWSQIDTRDTVLRDRNHPSVIIYSVGNEIRDNLNNETGFATFTALRDVIHRFDPTRPVTMALFRPNQSGVYQNGFAELMDVVGQNYRENELIAAHQAKPERKVIGTENGHDRRNWLAMRDHPFYSGQFLWTGIDYLGEARSWPTVGASSGLFDRTGRPRPLAYQRQSWWSERPMVHVARRVSGERRTPDDPGFEPLARPQVLFPDWTPRNAEPHEENLEVYSNCEQVELFLNGRSLGSLPRPADDSPRNWRVPFEPGTLRAVGMNGGKAVASHELRTAGKPAKIVLAADRTRLTHDWDDVSYVTVSVVDENGILVPDANHLISFKVTGPGVLAAVDNGDNTSHEPFQANERHAYKGRCIAILRATAPSGRITLTATAPGLAGSSITIAAVAPSGRR